MGNLGQSYDPCADDPCDNGGTIYRHKKTGKEIIIFSCGLKGDKVPPEENLKTDYIKVGFKHCY